MTPDDCTYEEFLESWAPSRHLEQACLPSNLDDPVAIHRLLQDFEATGDVPRVIKEPETYNGLTEDEAQMRRVDFLKEHQEEWAADFSTRMLSAGVREDALEKFVSAMATDWVQSYSVRQKSPVMLAIKASIQAHDRLLHRDTAGRFVIDDGDFGTAPLFTVEETAQLFQTNFDLLTYAMQQYVRAVYGVRAGAVDMIYARRGICMPHEPKGEREERSYLSSFSLGIGPTELFAQTMGRRTCKDIKCIISCPVLALCDRVVAFAPFISGMPLDQIELVVAPPVEAVPLVLHGTYGDVREYSFM